jgi:hypothetical protein
MPGEDTGPALTLGQVGRPHGIRGWVLVRSFADPPDSLNVAFVAALPSFAASGLGPAGLNVTSPGP